MAANPPSQFGVIPAGAASPSLSVLTPSGLAGGGGGGSLTPEGVISERLVPFRDISELTAKNAQLLRTVLGGSPQEPSYALRSREP